MRCVVKHNINNQTFQKIDEYIKAEVMKIMEATADRAIGLSHDVTQDKVNPVKTVNPEDMSVTLLIAKPQEVKIATDKNLTKQIIAHLYD